MDIFSRNKYRYVYMLRIDWHELRQLIISHGIVSSVCVCVCESLM